MVAREGASERKEEAFSGKKSSARLKKRVHSLSVHFFERLFVEKTRGEEEENSTCERFITRRSEREKERRTKKKKTQTTRTYFNLFGNEKCPTESRRIRFSATRTRFTSVAVGRRRRYVYCIYSISLIFPLKIFYSQKQNREANIEKKEKNLIQFSFWTVGRDSAFWVLFFFNLFHKRERRLRSLEFCLLLCFVADHRF